VVSYRPAFFLHHKNEKVGEPCSLARDVATASNSQWGGYQISRLGATAKMGKTTNDAKMAPAAQ